jgi:hypothetical protein
VVAAIVTVIPGIGLWLELKSDDDTESKGGRRLPGWAALIIVGCLAAAPSVIATLIGADPVGDWPVLAGMITVVIAICLYQAWMSRR